MSNVDDNNITGASNFRPKELLPPEEGGLPAPAEQDTEELVVAEETICDPEQRDSSRT